MRRQNFKFKLYYRALADLNDTAELHETVFPLFVNVQA